MGKDSADRYAEIFKALAHPARVCIVRELLGGKCCVNSLLEIVCISQPNISQHLAVLKKCGLVHDEVRGAKRCYCIVNPKETKNLINAVQNLCAPKTKKAQRGGNKQRIAAGRR